MPKAVTHKQGHESKRILVTGISTDPGVSIVRQLTESGHDVIGADWRRLPFGLHSRHLRKVHILPPPMNPAFDRSLVQLVNALRPDAFLPLIETPVVAAACRYAAEIECSGALNIPGDDAFRAAFDKNVCAAECRELGIPCPEVYSPDEAVRVLAYTTGIATLVVKPGTDAGFARDVEYVQREDELHRSFLACKARYGSAIIQEWIPGDVRHMHTAALLFDRNSELIAAFTMQKLRQWPSAGGITALGISTDEHRLVHAALPFFRKWRWRGPAEIEWKFDPRDSRYKIIEINPRFPGYLRFPMVCGLPLANLAASLASGDRSIAPLKYPSYKVGMKYASPATFLRSTVAELRSFPGRAGALGRAISDLSGTGKVIGNMLGDPLPMAGRVLLDIGRLIADRR